MDKQLTKKEYKENFEGFIINNMAISANGHFFCTLVEDIDSGDETIPLGKRLSREGDFIYRFLYIELEKGNNYVTFMETRVGIVNRALIIHSKTDGWISVDFNGWVWEGKVQELQKWPGYDIPQTDPIEPKANSKKPKKLLNAPIGGFGMGRLHYIKELKVIDNEVYVCGSSRKVIRRDAYDKWTDITLMSEHPQLHHEYLEAKKRDVNPPLLGTFSSVDGFNKNDIYACGGKGDCWHYDGKTWKRMDIPTNMELNKIVCANDGNVYIASRDGLLIKGRAKYENKYEHWELIKSDIEALSGNPFEGITWFKDKLYVSTSYGLYELEKDKLKVVEFGKEAQFSFQNVISNDDILISYGSYNALVFDGKKWKTIVSSLVTE